jgi:hypothetical protein
MMALRLRLARQVSPSSSLSETVSDSRSLTQVRPSGGASPASHRASLGKRSKGALAEQPMPCRSTISWQARKCPLPFLACRKEAPLPCDIPCQKMRKPAEVAIFARLNSGLQASLCSICLGFLSVSTRNDDNKQSRTCLVSGAILEGVEPCRHTTTFTFLLSKCLCAEVVN